MYFSLLKKYDGVGDSRLQVEIKTFSGEIK